MEKFYEYQERAEERFTKYEEQRRKEEREHEERMLRMMMTALHPQAPPPVPPPQLYYSHDPRAHHFQSSFNSFQQEETPLEEHSFH